MQHKSVSDRISSRRCLQIVEKIQFYPCKIKNEGFLYFYIFIINLINS